MAGAGRLGRSRAVRFRHTRLKRWQSRAGAHALAKDNGLRAPIHRAGRHKAWVRIPRASFIAACSSMVRAASLQSVSGRFDSFHADLANRNKWDCGRQGNAGNAPVSYPSPCQEEIASSILAGRSFDFRFVISDWRSTTDVDRRSLRVADSLD